MPELVQRERDWLYQPGNPELTETVERAYAAYEPMAKFPEAKASAEFAFTRTAAVSGLTYEDMVQDQQHLTALGLIFQHTLSRAPSAAEVSKYLPQLKANTQNWKSIWREQAQSAERDSRFGYYASSPLTNYKDNTGRKISEQCFGGVGPKCDAAVPAIDWLQFKPVNRFALYGQPMEYLEGPVVVGSILHDNTCVRNPAGFYCHGTEVFGEIAKNNNTPAALEWNKAVYNARDTRGWRTQFGPYPSDKNQRLEWSDDLRFVPNRHAKMARIAGLTAERVPSVVYNNGETKATLRLKAPSNTSVDQSDVEFCASKAFSRTGANPGEFTLIGPWGICR